MASYIQGGAWDSLLLAWREAVELKWHLFPM